MSKQIHVNRRWLFIFVAVLILFETYYVVEYLINTPTALSEKATLANMADQIKHPKSTQLVKRISGNKTTSAFVTDLFTSRLSVQDLVAFYSIEFPRQGFSIAKTSMTNNQDYDEQHVVISFCKGNYTVWLRYKSPTRTIYQETDQWNYAIDLSWWNRGCEPR